MVVGALGHAHQAVHLGQHHLQRAALAQHLEHARGLFPPSTPRQLLPRARPQVVGLAVRCATMERISAIVSRAPLKKSVKRAANAPRAGCAPGRRGRHGHVAQHLVAQVARRHGVKNGLSARGICVKVLSLIVRSRRQVFFQRHVGRGLHHEAPVAAPALALGAGQRVLPSRVWGAKRPESRAPRAGSPGPPSARAWRPPPPVVVVHGRPSGLSRTAPPPCKFAWRRRIFGDG